MNDEQLSFLAEQSYWVEKGRDDTPYVPKKNEIYYYNPDNPELGQFKVLEIHDNKDSNGMQSMAVSPIKDGKVDTSNVVIAYAGTNFDDRLDRNTDLSTIGGGNDWINTNGWWESPNKVPSQTVSAKDFAIKIKNEYPNSTITTTGHSLGEFLAMYIAAENKWKNVGFNGPDAYGILSKGAKEWIKKNPGWLTNYRNRGDGIGNLMGNGTGAEVLISLNMGFKPDPLLFHNLSTWKFENGNLIIPKNDYNKTAHRQMAERELRNQFILSLASLSLLEKKFKASGGGISKNERIYLDDSQDLAVVQLLSSEFDLVMTNTIKIYKDGIRELEELWETIKSKAFNDTSELSYQEVMDALESVGCNKNSMVTIPSEEFQKKIEKANKMGDKLKKLALEIKSTIADMVQKDEELSRQFN